MADSASGPTGGPPAIPGMAPGHTDHALDAELIDRAIARPAVRQRRDRRPSKAQEPAPQNRRSTDGPVPADGAEREWLEAFAPSFSPGEVVTEQPVGPTAPPPWPQEPEVDEDGVPVLRSIDSPAGRDPSDGPITWGWRETWTQRPPSEWELDPGALTSPSDLHALDQGPSSHDSTPNLAAGTGSQSGVHWPAPPELRHPEPGPPTPADVGPDGVSRVSHDVEPMPAGHGMMRQPLPSLPSAVSPAVSPAPPVPDSEPTQGIPAVVIDQPAAPVSPPSPVSGLTFLPAVTAPADVDSPPASPLVDEPISDLLPSAPSGLGPFEEAAAPVGHESTVQPATVRTPATGWDRLIDTPSTGTTGYHAPASPGFAPPVVIRAPEPATSPVVDPVRAATRAPATPDRVEQPAEEDLDWQNGRDPREKTVLGTVGAWLGLFVAALVFAFAVRTFVGQAYKIPSGSMLPTLEISDRVVVNKLSFSFGSPERGDLIVFERPEGTAGPEEALIKRVLALPGETVVIQDGEVYVDRRRVGEDYLRRPSSTFALRGDAIPNCPGSTASECTVPPGTVFVMGDHRGDSTDSRAFGPIDEEQIVGRAFYRMWPLGRLGRV